ncbi:cysteine synthase family protein [Campylobacter sp. MIT 21-1685]|uniref:cysteine synthase family protein n=1 Tax=unclassified Campylobacter TaxID=2593542 RepID=UPI00224B9A64|nr:MULTISPECIES: cysteine synthase family protein [unclassified Campylobacter]MCX2682594.1 cysteine synthase family protein [Campylobacter sp. MIT 21-1684]MCX2750874.1 cysteine synthase family protein [Campylobacter sp. MIT 21-1682]MCX2807193.1 cysteine synthase family protein [Campylobacter sp. MIT 21-1685]
MLYTHICQSIGNTPLIELKNIQIANANRILAKCEFFNPAGSVKDRIGLYALEKLLEEKIIHKKSIIVSASAGNTGLGLALACVKYDLKTLLFIPNKFSLQKQLLIKALGASIVNTQGGMQEAMKLAKDFAKNEKNAFYFDQFESLYNPETHYKNTARELYEDANGEIDLFVSGAGSGGVFSGVSRFLKEKNPAIKCILCDPCESIIGGNPYGESHIEGIGNTFIPETMDTSLIDEVIKMQDEQAYNGVKILAKQEGILAGISSGACLSACLKLAEKVQSKTIVTIFADGLERYLDREELIKDF